MDGETAVWQIELWGCCGLILLPAYSVISCLPAPTHQHQPCLYLLFLPLIYFITIHSPVWEDSCAAAAILNYIGQWEIVFAGILCLVYVHNSSLLWTKGKRQYKTPLLSWTHTSMQCVPVLLMRRKKKINIMQTGWNKHANEPWEHKQQTKIWHMVLMEQKTHKNTSYRTCLQN